jgi:hypothetical protein
MALFKLLSVFSLVAVSSQVLGFPDYDYVDRQEFNSLKKELYNYEKGTLSVIMEMMENSKASQQQESDSLDQCIAPCLEEAKRRIEELTLNQCVGTPENPAQSCKDIPSFYRSGYYWIKSSPSASPTEQYCDMSPPCGCLGYASSQGWMRVANIIANGHSDSCPGNLVATTVDNKHFCKLSVDSACTSVTFPVHGVSYSKVCGKVIGYQFYDTNGFGPTYYHNEGIDGRYIDGISLTHGESPRSHIWTFAAALDETSPAIETQCPCIHPDTDFEVTIPDFVGNSYFCDTGSHNRREARWYTENPLWDGEGCGEGSACCEGQSPPWFCKDLEVPTTDDIELRVCVNSPLSDENVGLGIASIYIQ